MSAWATCGPSESKEQQEFWKTDYKEKTHGKAPKEFILEVSGQPMGEGETRDHSHATSLGEGV